MFCT